MKRINFLFLALIVLFLMSCASTNINFDYDRQINFSKFKTYKWIKDEIPGDQLRAYGFVKKAVVSAINQQLKEKGYILKEVGNTDFSVAVHATTKQNVVVSNNTDFGFYRPWWGPFGNMVDVNTYTEGTLAVDIVDVKDNELAWRGLITKIVDNFKNDQKGQAMVDEYIAKLLVNFPPPESK